MEPHDNPTIDLRKAINAHEQAEAALADLVNAAPGGRHAEMLARVQANLEALRAEEAESSVA